MKTKIIIKTEFIKLGQAMKLAGLLDSGALAKQIIADGLVSVNGQLVNQRGKKLYPGDHVICRWNQQEVDEFDVFDKDQT